MPAHVDEEEHGEAEAVLQAESVRPAHMDHDYAVPPASVQEQLEAANQRIAELEDTLGKERKSHFSLQRLKVGFDEETLSDLFRISQSTVSRILITWINFLYAVLGSITVWPSREAVQRKMPCVFKTSYPKTRVILDCTEIQVQTPSSKVLNGMAYSYCKGHTTYKSLVGISPDGTIVFVSSLYTGSISDKDITARSGLLDLLEEGDEVMVDKGFPIQDLLMKKKASLVIPPFLGQDEQFSSSEVILTQNIARLRVHVERAIRRVKEYKILQQTIPLTLAGSVSQLWTVCALLTNFRGKLY
ncbi:hypothetical protein BaRGS_00027662 [Batillaria attramentaria]|uniref:Tick transposon n=1 Tax=Batillaria attramentaria TaxID=370345 RepID=A0ABD0K231_9CAEN